MDAFTVCDVTHLVPIFGTHLTFSPEQNVEILVSELLALKEHGLTSLRWRLSWNDVFPQQGKPSGKHLELLEGHASAFADAGIETWVTLCGTTLPRWFLNEGAFSDNKATEKWWPRYVDTVAEVVGNHVAGWMPFEAPIALVHDGWRVGTIAPFVSDDGKFADAFTNVLHSWNHACRLLHGSPIALSLDATHPGANAEVRTVWQSAITRGRVSLPGHYERELDGLLRSADEIALSLTHLPPRGERLEPPRWRDQAIETLQWAYEAFSGTPLSVSGIPSTSADGELTELLSFASQMVDDLKSDGLALQHVWLSSLERTAGLTSLPAFSSLTK